MLFGFCPKSAAFLANPHFILQISHAKTFKKKYTSTIVLSKNILKVTKTDYVWFEFLLITH